MVNLIFDATILTSIYDKNAGRSGIFFASFNIFKEMLKRKDVNVALFASPRCFAEYKKFKNEFFPQLPDLYCRSCNRYITRLYFWLKKTYTSLLDHALLRKPFALFLHITHYIISCSASRLINYEEMNKYDVFFSPVYGVPKELLSRQIKKCYMLYDAIPLMFPEYYPTVSFLNDIKRDGKRWDLFFFDSRSSYNDFKKFFPFVSEKNSCIVHLAADKLFSRNDESTRWESVKGKYHISHGKKFVFSLCTREPRKNMLRAVKCFVKFVNENDIKDLVWILGGGHWRNFFDQFAKETAKIENFSKYVFPIGYVDDADLPIFYSNAEWFVYTSQYEGFGLPPLEAMQCGCPVITSNNSSLPEVVGDAGIMIDWDDDVQHIEAYKSYYFNEELRKENSRKGLERAKQFSWEKTADKMVEFMGNNRK